MGARNRIGIGLSYRPARLHTTQAGEIDALAPIPGYAVLVEKVGLFLEKVGFFGKSPTFS